MRVPFGRSSNIAFVLESVCALSFAVCPALAFSTVSIASKHLYDAASRSRHANVGSIALSVPCRGKPLKVSSLEEGTRRKRSKRLKRRTTTENGTLMNELEVSKIEISQEVLGFLALAVVPVLWGTYGPLVRFVFAQEISMPGFVFSSCYFTVASLSTVALSVFSDNSQQDGAPKNRNLAESVGEIFQDKTTLFGGLELGFYVLMASCVQVVALETVSSDKAGFLFQMSTVFVPIVSALLARDINAVGGRTWLACLMAFVGIVFMNLDPTQDPSSVMSILSSFGGGEGLMLLSALLYTMNIVRIGEYADKVDALKLTSVKTTFEAIANWAIVGGLLCYAGDSSIAEVSTAPRSGIVGFAESAGQSIQDFTDAFGGRLSEGTLSAGLLGKMGGAIAWAGLMCTAAVVAAQSYGQRLVKASDANLIYSLQPIFTAGFGSLLLGEQMDSRGLLGGGIILSAVLLVASGGLGNADAEPSSETST